MAFKDLAFKNFKVETDTDGIALVTWDIPGRSMNVLDETSAIELETIVKESGRSYVTRVVERGKETRTEKIEETLTHSYFKEPLRMRGNAADSSVLYLDAEVFLVCFPGRDPEFTP